MIEAWFDGVCEPINPGGHAAYGAVVKIDGSTVMAKGAYVGQGPSMSNNVAEYAGVIAVLDEIATMSGHDAVIYGDSRLVINQLNGEWRAKGGLYFDSYLSAKDKLANLPMSVRLRWILRERNAECDSLSKAVLRERGIRFQLQAEEDDKDPTPRRRDVVQS